MPGSETILFEYGTEGGGATVYRLPDNSVIEKGSSGGILDEEEDPIRKWERPFNTFEDWWQYFTDRHKEFWIMFSPLFIHDDIKPLIKTAVNNYNYPDIDVHYTKPTWIDRSSSKE